jgi:hypothetical protein
MVVKSLVDQPGFLLITQQGSTMPYNCFGIFARTGG